MDIALLSRMTKDLLQQHETLSLPAFGNFYFEIADASFTDKGFAITPPYRVLSFSAGQGQDNLLAECYANANGIDLAHAKRVISEFCAEIKDKLLKSKALDFPGLGRMKATAGGTIFFVAEENLELCPAYDILEKVSLRYIPDGYATATATVAAATATAAATTTAAAEKPSAGQETKPVAIHTTVTETAAKKPAEEPAAHQSDRPATASASGQKGNNAALRWILTIIVLVLVFFILLAAAGRLCPDIIDRLLYNDAQLEMLNYLKN